MAYDKDKMEAVMAKQFGKSKDKGKDKESKKPKASEDCEKVADFFEEALFEGLNKAAEESQEHEYVMDAIMFGVENPSIVTKIARAAKADDTTMEDAINRLRTKIQG